MGQDTHGKLRNSRLVAGEGQVQERGETSDAAAFWYRELLVHSAIAMGNQKEGNKARSLEENPGDKNSEGHPEWAGAQVQARIPAPELKTQRISTPLNNY